MSELEFSETKAENSSTESGQPEKDSQLEWDASVEGKQIECIQSIFHRGGSLCGFTVRFTDGSLLKVDAQEASGIAVEFIGTEQ